MSNSCTFIFLLIYNKLEGHMLATIIPQQLYFNKKKCCEKPNYPNSFENIIIIIIVILYVLLLQFITN